MPNCNNQSIQHFISNSLWNEQGLIYQIQDDVADLIGDKEKGSLQLDESGFPKQGENSAGVKAELGLEMILDAKKRNIPFRWVGMDSFYGEQPWLLNELDEKGVWYIADIPCDSRVWLNKPIVGIPQKNGIRGRNPTIEKVISPENPLRVDKLVNDLDSLQWHRVYLRDSERKEMWCKLACLRVYPVNDSLLKCSS